ncbi:MAG: hypothetical protein OCC45_03180 [Desulfotalea sp.]
MKNKISKKRKNIQGVLQSELCAILPIKDGVDKDALRILVLKNSFYHARLYLCLMLGEEQFAHIILSRKKDYILKVIIAENQQKHIDVKEVARVLQKNFPCKAKNFMAVYGILSYSEQHPNDIIK